jgi:Protein of unknown function (DUF3793)
MVSKVDSLYKLLNRMEDKEYIENFISYNVALISAKLKPSITLNLFKNNNKKTYFLWNTYGEEYLKKLGLNYIELRENDKALIVFIYSEELLKKVISNYKSLNFLGSIGYENCFNIKEVLQKLKERYSIYNCPHELGIFLGYPLEDVKDFMECTEKKCLACGYWKVYNECNKAKTVFALFDKVKEHTAENILIGNRHINLSNILKDKFEKNQKIVFG